MTATLNQVARTGNIDGFYTILECNPKILDDVDIIPFVDTPMHFAAAAGHTNFVMEMFHLRPSFAKKLNTKGYSPMHLALQNLKYELVFSLVHLDRELIRVKGKLGESLLHLAAKQGNLTILHRFLCACPESIQDLTSLGETVIHVAIKHNRQQAVELIIGWILRPITYKEFEKEKILNWRDNNGNAVIHLAISKRQVEVVRSLIRGGIYIDVVNLNGLTALQMLRARPYRDVITTEMLNLLQDAQVQRFPNLLTRVLGYVLATRDPQVHTLPSFEVDHITSKMGYLEKWMYFFIMEINSIPPTSSSAVLVVCVLIVSSAYQAIIRPPSSILNNTIVHMPFNESSTLQNDSLDSSLGYFYFTCVNTVALFLSMSLIILLLPFHYAKYCFLTLAFSLTMFIASPMFGFVTSSSKIFSGVILFLFSVLYGLLQCTIYSSNLRRKMYVKQFLQFIVRISHNDQRNNDA